MPRAQTTSPPAVFAGRTETQVRILDAALDLFVERGFHGTTVPEIARRAGLAAGTLYLHFESKEDLVNALIAHLKRDIADALVREVPAKAGIREQFEAIWTVFARHALERPRATAFLDLHHHAPYVTEETLEAWAHGRRLIDAHFRAGKRAGVYRDLPVAALRAAVCGVLTGACKFARMGELSLTRSLLDRLGALAWAAVIRGTGDAS